MGLITTNKKVIDNNYLIASTIIDSIEKWGIIDGSNSVVVPFVYDEINYIEDGYCVAKQNNFFGIINKSGDEIIPCMYDKKSFLVSWIKHGRFDKDNNTLVSRSGLLGFINDKGSEVYPCKYEKLKFVEIGWIETSFLYVKENGLLGLIDTSKGKEIIPCKHRNLVYLRNNLIIAVTKDHLSGIYNNKGDIVVPFVYEDIGRFFKVKINDHQYKYGVCPVTKNGKIGFVNTEGTLIIPCQFDKIEEDCGLIILRKDGLSGIIRPDGNFIVPCIYEQIVFNSGLWLVKRDRFFGLLNYDGDVVLPCQYDNICMFNDDNHNPLYLVSKDNLQGVISWEGKEVIPCLYDIIEKPISYNMSSCIVAKDGFYGIINIKRHEIPHELRKKKGSLFTFSFNKEEVIPCQYEKIEYMKAQRNYKIKKDGLFGLMDIITYDILVPCIYSEINVILKWGYHSYEDCGYKARRNDSYFYISSNGIVKSISEKSYNTKDDKNEEDCYSWPEEKPSYGRYAGSWAQDEEGYSDDDIDTIFDGDPDAYWNID